MNVNDCAICLTHELWPTLQTPIQAFYGNHMMNKNGNKISVTTYSLTNPNAAKTQTFDINFPIQTATAADIDNSGALDLSDFMNRRLNGVYLNEMQGNPFQPDVNFRGYTASPLLGTPKPIRSDEWAQNTPDILNQVLRSEPFAEPRCGIAAQDHRVYADG